MNETQTADMQEKIMNQRVTTEKVKSPGLTEPELCGWLRTAAPGDELEYHRGFLPLDTRPDGSRLIPADRKTLTLVARRALWAGEQGWVHLVQCRRGPCDFSYVAIARPWTNIPQAVLLSALAEELPE